MATTAEIQARAAELRRARGLDRPTSAASRMTTSTAAVAAPEQESRSRMSRIASAAADTFRKVTPRMARDVAGKGIRTALSGERFINAITPGEMGTDARRQLERVPVVGDTLSTGFDVALAPVTLLTAGKGGAIAGMLQGAGRGGRIAGSFISPLSSSPNFGMRLLSETILGTGGTMAGEAAEKHNAPMAVQLAAGVFGGAAALGGFGALRGAAGTFTRDASKIASQQWGHDLGSRTFVADLLPGERVLGEIRTSADPLESGALGNRFINPSLTLEDGIGKAYNAFTRQFRRGTQLSEVATGAALDPHSHGAGLAAGVGGRLFNMADDGSLLNISAPEGVSRNWYDVFETPDAPQRFAFSDEQTAYWKDWHQTKQEMTDLLISHGLIKSKAEADEALKNLHVPRQVRNIREAEVRNRGNSLLERTYETAQEGVAAGIKYENDPKVVLQTYLQSGYKMLAEQQLDEMVASSGNLVTAKQVLIKTAPAVVNRVEQAAKKLVEARRVSRHQRSMVIGTREQMGGELLAVEKRLGRAKSVLARAEEAARNNAARARRDAPAPHLQRRLDDARARVDDLTQRAEQIVTDRKTLPDVRAAGGPAMTPATADMVDAARREFESARAAYKRALDNTSKATVLPGHIFGKTERDINVGQWKGKFLPESKDYLKLAEQVNTMTGRAYPVKLDPLTAGTRQIADNVRYASAIGDLAMPFIQGLPLLGQNPVLWAKMAAQHYKGFLDPTTHGRYIRDHMESVQEMAQFGVPIGDVEQLIAGSRGGGVIQRASGTRPGRQTLGRLEAAYDSGLTSARVQLWEALKPVWDGTPDELARVVRNMTGGLDSAALGITPTQRALEGVWMGFSPRLMRSTIALVGMAANPNSAAGRQAARALLGLTAFAGAMATTTNIGIGLANGESREEIEQRISDSMNPLQGRKFMAIDIGGQYVGVGGQVRAISQFVARAATNPGGFLTADQYDNPLINFYMSRGAVGVNVLGGFVEGATGERVNVLPFEQIDSIPDAVLHLGKASMPFVVQAQMEAKSASLLDRATLASIGFGGLNIGEKSPSEQVNDKATERFGKPYGDLTGEEQTTLQAENIALFAEREKYREETGGRDERVRRQKLAVVDQERIQGERALVDAYARGALTDQQFRDEMKSIQRDAAVRKRDLRVDFDDGAADENKAALTAWYATFDQAKLPGTEIVDWDTQEKLEGDLLGSLTAEQKRYVDERRRSPHAEEAQWYFDNEDMIRESGYYETIDEAFKVIAPSLPSEITNYSQLVLALNRAQDTGDMESARYLQRLRSRVDRVADRQKRALRRSDPDLDTALRVNGKVTKPVT